MQIRIFRPVPAAVLFSLFLTACFYPPMRPPPAPERTQVTLQVPYDLALDSVMHVIRTRNYRIQANDPTHGVIEAQTAHFSASDADCGVVGTTIGKEAVAPTADSSAVYNFYIKPNGPEASMVTVQAVFSTPVSVPFHTLQNTECVSRGVQEAALLKEIEEQASLAHRPAYKQPPG
jgi:hypothetical protein